MENPYSLEEILIKNKEFFDYSSNFSKQKILGKMIFGGIIFPLYRFYSFHMLYKS